MPQKNFCGEPIAKCSGDNTDGCLVLRIEFHRLEELAPWCAQHAAFTILGLPT
jgi:hypothetical protein